MRIAIVIPVHDEDEVLEQAMASVRAQARAPDEIVLVDDRSTNPKTLALLDRLARERSIKVVHNPINLGLGESRNAGIAQTSADAVLPLDADDELLPIALSILEKALLADPAASFASGHVRYFGAVKGSATVPRFNPYLELDQNPQLPLALFRGEIFRARGLRYPPLRAFEDWGLWLAIIEAGLRGTCVEEPVYRYRRKGSEGLLAWGETHRPELEAELRRLQPSLYSPEGRRRLKETHAPALEIVWSGGANDPALGSFLAAQTLPDVSVTARSFAGARELLGASRGKVLLQLAPDQLALLGKARQSLLEQALRFLDGHRELAAVAIPLDRPTLEAHATRMRVGTYTPERMNDSPLDLIFLRTARAAELREAHLPEGARPAELCALFARRGRMSLFAEDFARLVREPVKSAPLPAAPRDAALRQAVALARPAWRRARRAAERLIGAERLGRALHPWKLRAVELLLDADAAEAALRDRRSPLRLEPILPASVREEKRRLDEVPTDWQPLVREPRDRPRALLVVPWIVTGGVERALLEMAAALAADGWDLFAAAHFPATHDWEHRLLDSVRDVYLIGETTAPPQHAALIEIARRLHPDVLFLVHSWLGLESLRELRAALPAMRTVDYQHMDYQTPGGNFARVSCERHDADLDRRAVSTEYLIHRYQQYGVSPEKIRLIRAGCDEAAVFNPERVARGAIRAKLGIADSAIAIGFVARFVMEKDPLFVVRAFAAIDEAVRARGGPELRFVLVGDGPLRKAAESLAAALGLGERAHFLPPDASVENVLRDLDVLLMASRVEGLPLVFFEALALQTPVVTTAIEGIPELIDAEVGACVPDHRDEAERLRALVDAAVPLILGAERRRAAGEAGRRRIVERFSAEATREGWRRLFRDLYSARPNRAI